MKKNRFIIHISIFIINFLFIGIIFGAIFILIKQIFPIIQLSDSIKDSYFYCYNYSSVDEKYDEKDKLDTSYYYIDYVEMNEDYLPVLYLNEAALSNGIPFIYNDTILFFPLEITELPINQIVTNDENLVTSSIPYLSYFEDKKIKNYFLDLDIKVPYVCLKDHFEEITLSIYTSYPPHTNLDFWYNTSWENSICREGKNLKKGFFEYNQFQMILFVILSLIPILFTTIALGNFYTYYISSHRDDIIIQHIYYASEKKLIQKYFKELGVIAISSSILSIILMWSIILHQYSFLLGIGILCCFLMESLSIYFITRKRIKENLNYNLWRKIHD